MKKNLKEKSSRKMCVFPSPKECSVLLNAKVHNNDREGKYHHDKGFKYVWKEELKLKKDILQ